MTSRLFAFAAAAMLTAMPALAAETVKIGMLTTLSGPNAALGIDIRDAFQLAVKQEGGKLGGVPVEVIVEDDELKPDVAKEIATRMVKRDGVSIMTGIVFSNVAMAVVPGIVRDGVFFISANAGPSQLAGQGCHANYFNVAWQNDNLHEAAGQYAQGKGYQNVYILAPNYPAGKDALTGFKRFYKGKLAGEVYTQLGQTDYAADIATLRAANPDAVFYFLPGGLGVAFIKQFEQAGLKGRIPVIGPGFSFSQDVLGATGDSALGVINTSQWNKDIDNPANKAFVAAFQAAYGRLPSLYASQGYDAARLIGSALKKAEDPKKADQFRTALKAADFPSVRGAFRFGANNHPIQDIYVREVVKENGALTNKIVSVAFRQHQDAYVSECKM